MRSLGLNIHLPQLPLEIYKATDSEACPVVVWVGHGREQRVLLGNPVAQSLGIHPDMPMGAAYSLAKGLRVWARDEEAERLALERIALWCGQFTSTISLSPPNDLLLEVAGSLFLFGGARSLLERVRGGVAGLGYRLHAALAPTPLAATLLARARKEVCIEKTSALVAVRLDGLFDRLKARLGSDAIQGLGILSDHRPERAWRACLPGQESSEACELKTRPLWLVLRPVALRVKSGQPLFRGRPLVITECERIESGWWDGQSVSRDYFVALDADGVCLWIYRELNGARRWFLHGLF